MSRLITWTAMAVFWLAVLLALAGCNAYKHTANTGRDCELTCTDCGDFEFKCGSKGTVSETQTKVPQ